MFLQDVEKLVHWGQAIKMPIACCLDAAHTVNLKLGLVYNNIFNKALNKSIYSPFHGLFCSAWDKQIWGHKRGGGGVKMGL